MALDTRQKRMSVTGCGRPWLRTQDNDAAKAQAWRQSVGNIYAGNLVGAGAAEELFGVHFRSIPAHGQSIISGRFS